MLPWLCVTFSSILLGPTEIGYMIEYLDLDSKYLVRDLLTISTIMIVCGM